MMQYIVDDEPAVFLYQNYRKMLLMTRCIASTSQAWRYTTLSDTYIVDGELRRASIFCIRVAARYTEFEISMRSKTFFDCSHNYCQLVTFLEFTVYDIFHFQPCFQPSSMVFINA